MWGKIEEGSGSVGQGATPGRASVRKGEILTAEGKAG